MRMIIKFMDTCFLSGSTGDTVTPPTPRPRAPTINPRVAEISSADGPRLRVFLDTHPRELPLSRFLSQEQWPADVTLQRPSPLASLGTIWRRYPNSKAPCRNPETSTATPISLHSGRSSESLLPINILQAILHLTLCVQEPNLRKVKRKRIKSRWITQAFL